MDQDQTVKHWFKRMSHGVMQSNYTLAYEGFKELAYIGTPAVPYLKEILFDIDRLLQNATLSNFCVKKYI